MAETNARQAIRPEDLQLLPITCEATIPEAYIDLIGHMNVMSARCGSIRFGDRP